MKLTYFIVVPVALVLTACSNSDSSKSKDSDGYCSSQFVSDYNNVKNQTDNAMNAIEDKDNIYTYSDKVDKLKAAQNACRNFFSNHPNISCKAQEDNKPKQIYSTNWKKSCDFVENILAELNKSSETSNNSPSSSSPQPPYPQSTKNIEKPNDSDQVSDFEPNQIKVTILDASEAKKSLNNVEYVIVNGKVGTVESLKSDILNGSAICTVGSTESATWNSKVKNDLKLSVIAKDEVTANNGRRRLAMALEDATLSLGCMKLNSNPFTMKEVREAVKGIIEITVSK